MSNTLIVSASGIRGIVGSDLTPELVTRYAAALGHRASVRGNGRVVLGRDARTSGEMFARAAMLGAARTLVAGKFLCSRVRNISRPTTPVAPTTATMQLIRLP